MSSEMNDDRLNRLRQIETPAPSGTARQRALDAAMLAFDDAQRNSTKAPQGERGTGRLRSIFHALKGNWIMDSRVSFGLGTAAVALLLLFGAREALDGHQSRGRDTQPGHAQQRHGDNDFSQRETGAPYHLRTRPKDEMVRPAAALCPRSVTVRDIMRPRP